jgi:hypothetical protein
MDNIQIIIDMKYHMKTRLKLNQQDDIHNIEIIGECNGISITQV